MRTLCLVIAAFLASVVGLVWGLCFAWLFWLLGAKNTASKYNTFIDSIIFDIEKAAKMNKIKGEQKWNS